MVRFAVACSVLSACTLTHSDPPKPDGGASGSTVEVATYPAIPTTDLDILFQVDNSAAVLEVQTDFTAALPDFVAALDASPGGRPNVHIGVVNSDLGTSASATPPAPTLGTCMGNGSGGNLQIAGAPVSGTFVSDVDLGDGPGMHSVNYTGDLVSVLRTMLQQGASGCGFEQQLRATRVALEGTPINAGFARPNANLLVVVLTDEDDCSVRDSALLSSAADLGSLQSFRCTRYGLTCNESLDTEGVKTGCVPDEDSLYVDGIQQYTDFFSTLRGDRARTAVAVIAAPPTPVQVELRVPQGASTGAVPALANGCGWEGVHGTAVADPAVRLAALTTQMKSHGLFRTVCEGNQAEHAREIVNLANQMAGVVCLDSTVVDATKCVVTVEDAAGTSRDIPACTGTNNDCFEVTTDATACPSTIDNTRLVTHFSAPTADENVRVSCTLR